MSTTRQVLASTESVCPVCLQRLTAQRVADGDDVYLVKTCARHGEFKTVIWRGLASYRVWGVRGSRAARPPVCATAVERGCPFDCGLCPEHRQQSCCVLLEVTQRCNLRCPVCFAGAVGVGDDPSLAEIESWLRLLKAHGKDVNIQLSGGEPTLRDDLPQIVALTRALGFSFVQVNSNGLRLASEEGYAQALADAGVDCVFLQFDGVSDAVYQRIRGARLLKIKTEAIDRCARAGLGVVLVPTLVPDVNVDQIGAIVDFALARVPAVRAVHFQPISYFGRYPQAPSDRQRVTLPEVIAGLAAQTGGRLRAADFGPGSAENAYCSFTGKFFVGDDGRLRPAAAPAAGCCSSAPAAAPVASACGCGCGVPAAATDSETDAACDAAHARRFVAAHWVAPAPRAGGDFAGLEVPSFDAFLAQRRHSFCISGMAFQDAWTLDLERLRECFIHVVSPDRRVVPFCAYNLTAMSGATLYRPAPGREAMARENPLDAWTAAQIGQHAAPLTRAGIADHQLRRLRETLAWARQHSPFYRQRLAGFDVATLSSLPTLDALRRLPLTSADDLRRNDPPLLALSQSAISHVVTLETSGTSGPPKRVFFTADDQRATLDFFAQGMRLPARAGDRVLILFPGERAGSVGDLLARALTELGATPIAFGWPADLEAAADALCRERPDVVAGVPLPVLAVARTAAMRRDPPRVRSVLLSADHVAASLRRSLAALWDCEVFEHYGMTEMGLGGGVDCAAHGGYHMRESELLIEIVDPSSAAPVSAGDYGEVVFTTLTRRGMPLIRYRSGDRSRLLPGPCACGSPLLRLERIARRLSGGIGVGECSECAKPEERGELDIAMLDEALLAIDALADFDAHFEPGPAPTLTLTLGALRGAGRDALVASAVAALAGVPLLAAARRDAGWRLQIAVAPQDGLLPRRGKRTISVAGRA